MVDHVSRWRRIFGAGMLVVVAVVSLVCLWPVCHNIIE